MTSSEQRAETQPEADNTESAWVARMQKAARTKHLGKSVMSAKDVKAYIAKLKEGEFLEPGPGSVVESIEVYERAWKLCASPTSQVYLSGWAKSGTGTLTKGDKEALRKAGIPTFNIDTIDPPRQTADMWLSTKSKVVVGIPSKQTLIDGRLRTALLWKQRFDLSLEPRIMKVSRRASLTYEARRACEGDKPEVEKQYAWKVKLEMNKHDANAWTFASGEFDPESWDAFEAQALTALDALAKHVLAKEVMES